MKRFEICFLSDPGNCGIWADSDTEADAVEWAEHCFRETGLVTWVWDHESMQVIAHRGQIARESLLVAEGV